MGIAADGYVTPENLPDIASVNYSGRYRGMKWDANDLAQALQDYEYRADPFRAWVNTHHDADKTANTYLAMVDERDEREEKAVA